MKNSLLTLALVFLATVTFAQEKTYQLSSHILDISKGAPAAGITIQLEKMDNDTKRWTFVDKKVTDKNGRISDFLPSGNQNNNKGTYKLTYLVSDYFKKSNTESFYPFIEVVFQIKDGNHYHVPITLSAYGYSTYRGN